MTGILAGASALGSVAVASLSLHTGYGLLSRLVSPADLLDVLG